MEEKQIMYAVPGVRLSLTFYFVCSKGHIHPAMITGAEWAGEIKPEYVEKTQENFLQMLFPGGSGRIATEIEVDNFLREQGAVELGKEPSKPTHEKYFAIPTNNDIN